MKLREWEYFWKWLVSESCDNEWCVSTWLEEKMEEWIGLPACKECKLPGLITSKKYAHGYVTEEYLVCINCKSTSDHVAVPYKAKLMREMEEGDLSRNRIRSLVEEFDISEDDTEQQWIKEVIKEFNKEKQIALDFAKPKSLTRVEVDRINLVARIERKLKDDKNKEE